MKDSLLPGIFRQDTYTVTAEMTVDRRRLTFEVEVDGPVRRVSEGTHQRSVVSLDRMGS